MRITADSSSHSTLIEPETAGTPKFHTLGWSGFSRVGELEQTVSPLDARLTHPARILSRADLDALLKPPFFVPTWTQDEVLSFALALHTQLSQIRAELLVATQWETAFTSADCAEMVDAALSYLAGFDAYRAKFPTPRTSPMLYQAEAIARAIEIRPASWGTVAVMLPQNALLFLSVVCLLNALITGNRALLRFPPAGAQTMALLTDALWRANPPQNSLSVVIARGREFLEAVYATPNPALIHYLGASKFGGDVLKNAFESRKTALIDGTGNTWVWVGPDGEAAPSAEILAQGAIRYNGQTCTSVNGALIHPARYESVCQSLARRFDALQAGNSENGATIGGLFDAAQAAHCQKLIQNSGGRILCGGAARGNFLEPTLIQNPDLSSELVREGVFGPVLWVAPGTKEDFAALWPSNRYPLCAGVLDEADDANEAKNRENWWLERLPGLARLVVGGDPSYEHLYEPWGGYAPSGANSVGLWHQKYQRLTSVDSIAS